MLSGSGVRLGAVVSRTSEAAVEASQLLGAEEGVGAQDSRLESLLRDFSGLLFLTTADDALPALVKRLVSVRESWEGVSVIHSSAGFGLDLLSPFRGATTASLHPCYPISKRMERLPEGTCYTFAGDETLLEICRELVQSWAGEFIQQGRLERELYHAGCVLSAGHLAALLCLSELVLIKSGLSESQARLVSRSISKGIVEQFDASRASSQLITGPFARRDSDLIARHLRALADEVPQAKEIYQLVGELSQLLLGENQRN